jgi:hypothetical protein
MDTVISCLLRVWQVAVSFPGTFWGVVFGSILSLGGVTLTNRSAEKRLRHQFENDRTLRLSEREFALRREVYLEASEAISAAIASMGRFADLNVPIAALSQVVTDKVPVLGKVQIIAGAEVLATTLDVLAEIGGLFSRLTMERMPLDLLKQKIGMLDEQIAGFRMQQGQALELMKTFNLNGDGDKRRWEVILGAHRFETDRIAGAEEEKAGLNAEMVGGQVTFARTCLQGVSALGLLSAAVAVAVRKELGFPLDEATYLGLVQAAQAKQLDAFDRFLAAARTHIAPPSSNTSSGVAQE